MSNDSKRQTYFSQWVAVSIGTLFLLVQFVLARIAPGFACHRFYNFCILSLIGLVTGCAGWACGMALTPIGSQASGAQKILAGVTVFWSGVVVGHIKDLSGILDAYQKSPISPATKIRLVFGLGIFLMALCVTFNTRFDDGKKE
jgi:hypothetical protein